MRQWKIIKMWKKETHELELNLLCIFIMQWGSLVFLNVFTWNDGVIPLKKLLFDEYAQNIYCTVKSQTGTHLV